MPRKSKPLGDHKVGYKRPPEATRFKKGQSGNPRGRPKGSLDIATTLRAALASKVVVTEGGRSRTMTKLDVMVHTNVNKAAKGDARALQQVLALAERIGMGGEADAAVRAADSVFGTDELAVIARFMEREGGPPVAGEAETSESEADASSDLVVVEDEDAS